MQLLHNVAKFASQKAHLKSIYTTYIRPVLEQSSVVWHSSLTLENSSDLERVQKAAVRLIMGSKHKDYESSLIELNLANLAERRRHLCLTFAKRTLANPKVKRMFPLRKENRQQKRRHTEKFTVSKAKTERLRNSAILYMQRMLNKDNKQKYH